LDLQGCGKNRHFSEGYGLPPRSELRAVKNRFRISAASARSTSTRKRTSQ
jgi:hypothetical protein